MEQSRREWLAFRDTAFSVSDWRLHARDLYRAAKSLEPEVREYLESVTRRESQEDAIPDRHIHHARPYYLLMALAVESLLKGIAIQLSGTHLKNEAKRHERFPESLSTHDQLKLARETDLSLDPEEESLVRRLSSVAWWRGKYPVSREPGTAAATAEPADEHARAINQHDADDPQRLDRLYRKLWRELQPRR